MGSAWEAWWLGAKRARKCARSFNLNWLVKLKLTLYGTNFSSAGFDIRLFSSELALYSHSPKATHPRLLQLEQRQHQIVRYVCKSLYAWRTEQGESYSAVRCRKKVNDKNEPLIFINWQLRPWCYFYEALVSLIRSWRHSPSTLNLWTSLGKYNSGYDLWLWLLTLQSWNKHILVDMVAKPFTPVSATGRNSCRHSGFQVLCSCRGYVIFHNQPEVSQVLASSLSSGLLNVSGSFTEGWH